VRHCSAVLRLLVAISAAFVAFFSCLSSTSQAAEDVDPLWRGGDVVMQLVLPLAKGQGWKVEIQNLQASSGRWLDLVHKSQVKGNRPLRLVDSSGNTKEWVKLPFGERDLVSTNSALNLLVKDLKFQNSKAINLIDELISQNEKRKLGKRCSIYQKRVGVTGYVSRQALLILLINGLDGQYDRSTGTVSIPSNTGSSSRQNIDLEKVTPGGKITTKQLMRFWESQLRRSAAEFEAAFKKALSRRLKSKSSC